MEKRFCFNFCEILENIMSIAPKTETVIQKVMELAGYTKCHRIYVGSYFCSQYLLHLSCDLVEKLGKELSAMGIPITLVLPMFTEKDLTKGKEKIKELSALFGKEIDEITVNDYGMLAYIHQHYQVKINLGRLLFKDYRDPRYEEYYHQTGKPKYFTNQLENLCKEYEITGLELDITHEKLEISGAPMQVTLGVHVPYSYMTVGMVCEFASIPYDISDKFRPNLPCHKECLRNRLGFSMLEDRRYLKIGRTVYFEHPDGQVIGSNSYREIFAPIDLGDYSLE